MVSLIVQKDHPVLRAKAAPVAKEEFGGKTLAETVKKMRLALAACDDGVALAASQIGLPLRIFIVSGRLFPTADKKPGSDLVFINPRLTKMAHKKVVMEEGCLSVRWLYGKTKRAPKATIEAWDEAGKKFTRSGSGIVAQVFQHEIDHLNGILFTDHATGLKEMKPEQKLSPDS